MNMWYFYIEINIILISIIHKCLIIDFSLCQWNVAVIDI